MPRHSATSRIWKSIAQRCACKPLSSTERVKEESFPQLRRRSVRLSAGVGGAWLFGMLDSEELPNIASIIQTCSKLRGLLAHAAKSEIQFEQSRLLISHKTMSMRSKRVELIIWAKKIAFQSQKTHRRKRVTLTNSTGRKLQSSGVLKRKENSFQECAFSFVSTHSS